MKSISLIKRQARVLRIDTQYRRKTKTKIESQHYSVLIFSYIPITHLVQNTRYSRECNTTQTFDRHTERIKSIQPTPNTYKTKALSHASTTPTWISTVYSKV